ncbi:hypothetical protein BJ546DRAFT_949966 [Cryomyces antarcticus]
MLSTGATHAAASSGLLVGESPCKSPSVVGSAPPPSSRPSHIEHVLAEEDTKHPQSLKIRLRGLATPATTQRSTQQLLTLSSPAQNSRRKRQAASPANHNRRPTRRITTATTAALSYPAPTPRSINALVVHISSQAKGDKKEEDKEDEEDKEEDEEEEEEEEEVEVEDASPI